MSGLREEAQTRFANHPMSEKTSAIRRIKQDSDGVRFNLFSTACVPQMIRSFYPSTPSTTSICEDSSITEEIQVTGM